MLICQAIRFMSMARRCKKFLRIQKYLLYLRKEKNANSLMCKFKDNNLGIKKLVEAISKIFR